MMAAAPAVGEPPPRLPTSGYSLMTTADADIPFSPSGGDSLAFRNKNNRGTKNDVENHVTKTLFRRSAAAAIQHDPNRSALSPTATSLSTTHANAVTTCESYALDKTHHTVRANNFLRPIGPYADAPYQLEHPIEPIDANRAVTTPPTSIDLTPIAPPEPNNFIPRPFNLLSNPTAPSKRPSVDLAALQRQIRSNMQAHEEFRRRIGLPSEPPTSSHHHPPTPTANHQDQNRLISQPTGQQNLPTVTHRYNANNNREANNTLKTDAFDCTHETHAAAITQQEPSFEPFSLTRTRSTYHPDLDPEIVRLHEMQCDIA